MSMGPHIEWQVGEAAEQETIAKTAPARRSLRRRWIVISAIGLGVVLGLLYRSVPEPPPKPIASAPIATVIASPLSPLPTPQSLDAAIERDALRLASSAGEANHLIAFAAPGDKFADWYAALQNAFGRWGTLPAQALYTVSVSGTLPGGAWVTLGQYRHGAVYHATRFYRLENNRWVWTLPDRGFWSGATSVITARAAGLPSPITLQYPIEDTPLISPVLDRFSSVYQNLCASLKCPLPNDQSCARKRCQIASGKSAQRIHTGAQSPLNHAARALAVSTAPGTSHCAPEHFKRWDTICLQLLSTVPLPMR
jgi:hypothetical protein